MNQNKRQMWNFMREQGGNIINSYVEALLKVPSSDIADHFTDAIIYISIAFISEQDQIVTTWLSQALENVPITVFTLENKEDTVKLV